MLNEIKILYTKAMMKDCYEIAKLKGEVWNTTYRGIYSDEALDNYDIERNKQTFEKIVENPKLSLYIVKDAEKIVGFISFGEPYRPFLHYQQEVGLLYILKEYQKFGIGKKLFSIAKDNVSNNGYKEFFVTVNKHNENAIGFYIAMGGSVIHIDDDSEDKQKPGVKLHYTA